MKAVVAAFNLKKALVGAFSVIVQLYRLIVYSPILEPGWELDRAVGSGVMTLVIMLYIITLTSCCLVSLFHSIYTHLLHFTHFTPHFTFSNFIQILLMEKSNPETQIKNLDIS